MSAYRDHPRGITWRRIWRYGRPVLVIIAWVAVVAAVTVDW